MTSLQSRLDHLETQWSTVDILIDRRVDERVKVLLEQVSVESGATFITRARACRYIWQLSLIIGLFLVIVNVYLINVLLTEQ